MPLSLTSEVPPNWEFLLSVHLLRRMLMLIALIIPVSVTTIPNTLFRTCNIMLNVYNENILGRYLHKFCSMINQISAGICIFYEMMPFNHNRFVHIDILICY